MEHKETHEKPKKQRNYKVLLIVPLLAFFICFAYLGWAITTDNLNLDVDLQGGTQLSIESDVSVDGAVIEGILDEYDASVRVARGVTAYSIIISFDSTTDTTEIINTLKENGYSSENYSEQTIGPVLSSSFFQQALIALLIAFVLMAVVIFFIFKVPILSFYASLCPAFDIVEVLAVSQLIGIDLSLAVFASLLMLIGYSVDDDVMIASRVLRGKEFDLTDRFSRSFKTSATTTSATLVATGALFVISSSSVITQIAAILFIGLLFDFMNTWLFNVTLLRWYSEKKENV